MGVWVALYGFGCAVKGTGDPPPPDPIAGLVAGGNWTCTRIGAVADGGIPDAGLVPDAADPQPDANRNSDAAMGDGSMSEAGAGDAAADDAAADDAGASDAAADDAGASDAAPDDAGAAGDAGSEQSPDAGDLGGFRPEETFRARCWGGDSTFARSMTQAPSRVASLAVGDTSCAVDSSGDVTCWGANDFAQVGKEPSDAEESETSVSTSTARRVEVAQPSAHHACAQIRVGLECWGAGGEGQLGQGTRVNRPVPQRIVLGGLTDFDLGDKHTCAVAGGRLYCWGDDTHLQTSVTNATTPREVNTAIDSTPVAVATGRAHTCYLDEDGAVYCFGDDEFGQLGQGRSGPPTARPELVELPGPARLLSAGTDHTCAAGSSEVWCWGRADEEQTGSALRNNGDIVTIALRAQALALGAEHSCAVTDDAMGQQVRCWGSNRQRQLGAATLGSSARPVLVQGVQ